MYILEFTMKKFEKLISVTRVEVIDEYGRCFVATGVGDVELHLQDDDKTLKVFLRRSPVKNDT